MKIKDFSDLLKDRVLIMDGSTGALLSDRGYMEGVSAPEELNIKFPRRIADVYSSYIEAGSDIVLTNTFGANRFILEKHGLQDSAEEIIKNGVQILKKCAKDLGRDIIAAGDISSLGEYMLPLGKLSFDEAYNAFAEQAKLLSKYGADIIVIETITEIKELKTAILAAKDNFEGPVIAQMTFTEDHITATGTDLAAFALTAERLGCAAIGLNCSVGAKELSKMAEVLISNTNLPVSFKPNAGIPVLINKKTIYPQTIDEFLKYSLEVYETGGNMFGGCCGTNPQYIQALSKELKGMKPKQRRQSKKADAFYLSNRNKIFNLDTAEKPIIIGERINPTGKEKLQQELSKGRFSYLKELARIQNEQGAHLIDINTGIAKADEAQLLSNALIETQEIVSIPICIDSSSAEAIEESLKNCAGIPLINSINGEACKLKKLLPILKRYGCPAIALTIDEKGLPKNSDERLKIAGKILKAASDFGIPPQNIVFDYLVLAASASPEQTQETLKSIQKSKEIYPKCKTVLGISNISFGLPSRQTINATFLKMAIEVGLDFAIIDPGRDWSIFDGKAKALLLNKEKSVENYLAAFANVEKPAQKENPADMPLERRLYEAILYGDKTSAENLIESIVKNCAEPFKTANEIILDSLNKVGEKFSKKEYFLPQIIMSAEAAQASFAALKPLLKNSAKTLKTDKIIMATVKGDMHDIGKNIVAAVLESYGYEIFDLGVNVEAQEIIDKSLEIKPAFIGLSALMTSTMLEMETVIKMKYKEHLPCKVIVGGAAVTQKFADEIGADGYAKNAVEAADIVKNLKS
ncbi:MAG: homocysteine S-methyltransferase family protein [Elusimicrobiota bacterium]|jgi:5-methyltetrahydrofolate--homocysteine methyltransferase|nr:homocysteine S-methyltransferase family protein [Elusimicrobiota bacterium]